MVMAGHPHLYSRLSCIMGPTALWVSRDTTFTQFMKEWRPHCECVCVCACGVIYVLVRVCMCVCVAVHLPISVLGMCVCVVEYVLFSVCVLWCMYSLMCASMWAVEYALISVFVHVSWYVYLCAVHVLGGGGRSWHWMAFFHWFLYFIV